MQLFLIVLDCITLSFDLSDVLQTSIDHFIFFIHVDIFDAALGVAHVEAEVFDITLGVLGVTLVVRGLF